ncbi:MAG: hypothetical protein QOC76_1412 [Mycobacterium sp.]|jgi:hypothetical protein|nr:hypothetical protein [Mycobacterium sp.]
MRHRDLADDVVAVIDAKSAAPEPSEPIFLLLLGRAPTALTPPPPERQR